MTLAHPDRLVRRGEPEARDFQEALGSQEPQGNRDRQDQRAAMDFQDHMEQRAPLEIQDIKDQQVIRDPPEEQVVPDILVYLDQLEIPVRLVTSVELVRPEELEQLV